MITIRSENEMCSIILKSFLQYFAF